MEHKMTWKEMKSQFPDEWVAITDEEGEVDPPYGEIYGIVLAHHKDEQTFTRQLKALLTPDQLIDIRYTGQLLPDSLVGPVLWQISHTDS